MSFLDGLFTCECTGGAGGITVNPTTVNDGDTLAPGFVHMLQSPATETNTSLTIAAGDNAGKRVGLMVFGLNEGGTPGSIQVNAPDGEIQDDTGEFAGNASPSANAYAGLYREWLCDDAGNWFLVGKVNPEIGA